MSWLEAAGKLAQQTAAMPVGELVQRAASAGTDYAATPEGAATLAAAGNLGKGFVQNLGGTAALAAAAKAAAAGMGAPGAMPGAAPGAAPGVPSVADQMAAKTARWAAKKLEEKLMGAPTATAAAAAPVAQAAAVPTAVPVAAPVANPYGPVNHITLESAQAFEALKRAGLSNEVAAANTGVTLPPPQPGLLDVIRGGGRRTYRKRKPGKGKKSRKGRRTPRKTHVALRSQAKS